MNARTVVNAALAVVVAALLAGCVYETAPPAYGPGYYAYAPSPYYYQPQPAVGLGFRFGDDEWHEHHHHHWR
jgi:hypothetical protein